MISEERRYALHEALRHRLGDGPADSLMTEVFAMDPERVATKDDLAAMRGEIAEVRGEIAELRGEVRGEIAQLRNDNARQTRQLTLTVLLAITTQFAATAGVVVSVA